MKIELELDEAIALVKRAVEERGAYSKYEMVEDECVYFNEETREPSCILGLAFSYKGLTKEDFALFDEESSLYLNSVGVDTLVKNHHLVCDEKTMKFLDIVQSLQDDHTAYGRAFELALAETVRD